MSAMRFTEVKRKGPLNPKGGAALANGSSTEDGSYPCQCSANGLARPPYVGTRFHLARLSTWSARKNQVKQSFVPVMARQRKNSPYRGHQQSAEPTFELEVHQPGQCTADERPRYADQKISKQAMIARGYFLSDPAGEDADN